jgi:AraC-like DNA-binding protein
MEAARQQLDLAEENVLQVANRVGYANPGHFAAAFRKHFGVTPSAYLAHQRLATDLKQQ